MSSPSLNNEEKIPPTNPPPTNTQSDDEHSEASDIGRGYHSDISEYIYIDDFGDIEATRKSSASDLRQTNSNNNNNEPSSPKPEKTLNILKRTLSGRFRSQKIEKPKKSKDHSDNSLTPRDTTLHNLIRRGVSTQALTKGIKKSIHIDARDENDQTALHICCTLGNIELLRTLLKKGASVNSQDMNGFTPLHNSLISGHLNLAEILLESKGIDVTITNNQTASPLHYLVRIPVDDSNIVLYRLVLDLLIKNGIDVNLQNKQGETALHSSCLKANIHSAAFLIERYADTNSITLAGESCLHYAVRYGNTRLVRMLLENGADPTLHGSDGFNAVDIAQQYNQNEILDCFESLIGEPLPMDVVNNPLMNINPNLMNSPRLKLNSNLSKEGWIEVFLYNQTWTKVWAKVTNLSLTCYTGNLCEEVIIKINLTSTEVQMEEGTIMHDQEPYWCFTVSPVKNNNSNNNNNNDLQITVFGTRNPDLREDWVYVIDKICMTHTQLDKLYEKLRQLSNPRIKLRNKCRTLTQSATLRGVELLHNLIVKNFNSDFICNTIIQNIALTAPGLSEIMDVDDDNFSRVFVRFLLHKNIFVPFLKGAINYDIGKIATGDTLFREVSLSTRLLSTYLEGQEGKDYLLATVKILVNAMNNIDGSLEINPNIATLEKGDKNDKNDKNDKGEKSDKCNDFNMNVERIYELSQFFLDRVMVSVSRFPLKFREIMQYTKKIVDSMYPNMTHAVIGGFVFLRYLCPAIVSPEKFGLISKQLGHSTSRGLVLISKLLQSVSNGVEFDGTKEQFMTRLNPFIIKNRLYVNIFFDNLTNKESIKLQKSENESSPKLTKAENDFLEQSITTALRQALPQMKEFLKTKST